MKKNADIRGLRWAAPLNAWLSGGTGAFHLWHANGQPRLTVTDFRRETPIYAVTPSPDGRWLYFMDVEGMGVWNAASGARHAMHPGTRWAPHLCISSDGRRLAGICYVHEGVLLCAIDGDGTRLVFDHVEWDTELEGIAFSPDGTRLHVVHFGDEGQLILTERDPSTLERLKESRLIEGGAGALGTFLNDSEDLVFYRRRDPPGTFDVFSLNDGTRVSQVTVPMSVTGQKVALSASGRWLVLSTPRGEVERWDILTARRDGAWLLPEPWATTRAAVAPDGTVAVALENGQLFLLR
ncbi:WD40 repeat domain-containing protein [Archangium violaceum]|uniref:WD40 repeat domain-containing protein n=1 Tax=Archangium violaceum TaxID=83451 RepID=UPI0036D8E411